MRILKYSASSLLAAVLMVMAPGAIAQPTQPVVIEEVAAKVDDYIILKSDVDQTYLQYLSQGLGEPEEIRCLVMSLLVQNKVLYVQAQIDSIFADPAMVQDQLDRRFQYMVQQAGSEQQLEDYFGKTVEELKNDLYDEMEEQLTTQQMRNSLVGDLSMTPKEVRLFFESVPRDSIPIRPKMVEVAQIVVIPGVGRDEKARMRKQAVDIRQQILDGSITFADAAKKYSQDPGSGARGGELGWQGRGVFVPEFEAAIFNMEDGEISEPILSDFGYHIIQLIERRGNRFNSRHILLRVNSSQIDLGETENYLDSLKQQILIDSISFSRAAKEYSEDPFTAASGGYFLNQETGSTLIPAAEIGSDIFFAVDAMKVGEISEPMTFQMPDGQTAMRLLYYSRAVPAHRPNLRDDFEWIKSKALQRKEQEILNAWFNDAILNVYIEVDEEYRSCPFFQSL